MKGKTWIARLMAVVLLLSVGASLFTVQSSAAVLPLTEDTRKIIFIGDSRTAGMNTALTGDTSYEMHKEDAYGVWSARWGSRYDWFVETGIPAIEGQVDSNTSVVILMGYNDIVNEDDKVADYCKTINKMARKWQALGADTYYVSVNPAGTSLSRPLWIERNLAIRQWNRNMQNKLSSRVYYIDTYSKLVNGYWTTDDTHYTDTSYKLVYNMILERINEDHLSTHNTLVDIYS